MEIPRYWTAENLSQVKQARSFAELSGIAMEVISRMPQPIGQVCGPISSGGLGSIEANMQKFSETVQQLIAEGKNVFDQIPFENYIFKLIDSGQGTRSQNELLKEFYLPIFESGLIKTLYFIPGWESFNGATWEHHKARELGIDIVYLTK